MSLTGPLFLNEMIVLTGAAFLGIVFVWPRLTPQTPWCIAGRVAALLLVSLLVLLTAATQLNSTYLFFAGWSDLRGAITGHPAQTALDGGGAATRGKDRAVPGAAAVLPTHQPALSRPVGRSGLLRYTVHGARSGLTGKVLVQLPTGYTSAAASAVRYPVLEAFHGYPSEPLNWVRIFHIKQALAQQVRGAQAPPHPGRDPADRDTPGRRHRGCQRWPRTAADRVIGHHPPPVSLWVETSHADPVSYASTARFLRSVRTPTAAHAVILQNSGHRDSVWIGLLPQALRWLGETVPGFHP